MNFLIISFTGILLLSYALYLYKKRVYVSTLYWIAFYVISFILPNILQEKMAFGYTISDELYTRLNFLYFLMAVTFIVANFCTNTVKRKSSNRKYIDFNYISLRNTNNFFVFISFVIVAIIGRKILSFGSSNMLESINPLLDFIMSIVTFGIILTSILRLYYAETKKQVLYTIANIIYALLFGLIFSFARRLVIFPLIIAFCFINIMKRKKPKVTNIALLMIIMIVIVLPLMISVRTFGVVGGISNYISVITDIEKYKSYLAMSTDVSWTYSVAAIIFQDGAHVSLIHLLKPFMMFIPRTIWADKPLPLSVEIVRSLNLSDDQALSIPVSIVGESLVYFGIFGIFLFGLLWGIITSTFDKRIIKLDDANGNNNSFSIVVYVTLTVQVIAGAMRGDLGTTLQETELVILPVFIIMYLFNTINLKKIVQRIKKRDDYSISQI
jgi:oligosaccharide repeat unit polymerase